MLQLSHQYKGPYLATLAGTCLVFVTTIHEESHKQFLQFLHILGVHVAYPPTTCHLALLEPAPPVPEGCVLMIMCMPWPVATPVTASVALKGTTERKGKRAQCFQQADFNIFQLFC